MSNWITGYIFIYIIIYSYTVNVNLMLTCVDLSKMWLVVVNVP